MQEKVVLITGVSSGFGEATALCLINEGYRVYGISRSIPKNAALAEGLCGHFAVDVTDTQAVVQAVDALATKEGAIDIVLNNAGMGYGGALEELSIEQLKYIFDVNVFGVARVCNAVLPYMRQKRSGLIINVSSVAGLFAIPFEGGYSATKFAVEGYSEELYEEASLFGIDVCVVEPGDFCTGFTGSRRAGEKAGPASDYYEYYQKALENREYGEKNGYHPDVFAQKVLEIIRAQDRVFRYVVGHDAIEQLMALKREMPDKAFLERIRRRCLGGHGGT